MRKSLFAALSVAVALAGSQAWAVGPALDPVDHSKFNENPYYNGFGGPLPAGIVEGSAGFSTIGNYSGRVLSNAAVTANGVDSTVLTTINTGLFAGTDVNLYKIRVTDPTTFSASIGSTTLILALFDAGGNGVAASVGGAAKALTLANGVVTTPGFYYVGVANSPLVPRNNAGQAIFLSLNSPVGTAAVALPDPTVLDKALSTNALQAWSGTGAPLAQLLTNTSFTAPQSTITLAGANFAAVPEPASLVAAAGAAALGLARRRTK